MSQNRLGLFGADSLGATLTGARSCGALGLVLGLGLGVLGFWPPEGMSQRLQFPLIKEASPNLIRDPIVT